MNGGYAAAALLSLVTFCVHTFIGGVYAARPLLACDALSKASRWLNYFTWHMVTIYLFTMAAAFAAGAAGHLSSDAALLLAILSASFSILSIAVTLRAGIAPWRFPASYLLASVAITGFWGALA